PTREDLVRPTSDFGEQVLVEIEDHPNDEEEERDPEEADEVMRSRASHGHRSRGRRSGSWRRWRRGPRRFRGSHREWPTAVETELRCVFVDGAASGANLTHQPRASRNARASRRPLAQ